MIPINELLPYLGILSLVLTISFAIGGMSFRNGRQEKLAKFQNDTNTALQQRVTTLEGKAADLEKENIIQRHIIETITTALAQEGFIITVNGDLVTIENAKTGIRSHNRKRTTITQHSASVTKKEEDS